MSHRKSVNYVHTVVSKIRTAYKNLRETFKALLRSILRQPKGPSTSFSFRTNSLVPYPKSINEKSGYPSRDSLNRQISLFLSLLELEKPDIAVYPSLMILKKTADDESQPDYTGEPILLLECLDRNRNKVEKFVRKQQAKRMLPGLPQLRVVVRNV